MSEQRGLDAAEAISRATSDLQEGNTAAALAELARIPQEKRPPLACSTFAFQLAQLAGEYKIATRLCHEAIKKDPKNVEHYLHLGRILLLAGKKKDAMWTFRMGLRHGRHPQIVMHLNQLGSRKPPIFSSLERDNPLNKYLGLLLCRLRLR